jgi:hypothetical protein
VCQPLVRVHMLVALGEVQVDAKRHQHPGHRELRRQPIASTAPKNGAMAK